MCACRCMYMEAIRLVTLANAAFPPCLSLSLLPFSSIPPCLSLTNGAAHGNANFCAGRVVVLTRRKTSNGELTFSFVPRALSSASGGDDIFSKVAALNFTVDGCRSRSRAHESASDVWLWQNSIAALCYSWDEK